LGFCEVAAEIYDDSGFLCGGGRDLRHQPVFLWRRQGSVAAAGFHAAAPAICSGGGKYLRWWTFFC
jgi:hypothetical protein